MHLLRAVLLFFGVLGAAAVCPKTYCTTLPTCWDHGECSIASDGTETCACDEGWTGTSCDTRTCSSATCVNGDCCESGCCCYAGWSGVTCETFIGHGIDNMIACRPDGFCVCDAEGADCSTMYANPAQYALDLALMPITRGNVYIDYEHAAECDCRVGSPFFLQSGLRKLLRFSAIVYNAGESSLFLGTPHAPDFVFTCTNRPEFPNWIRYRLYEYTKTGPVTVQDMLDYYANPVGDEPVLGAVTITPGTLVASATKSQVVHDDTRISGEHYIKHFASSTQGITHGWAQYAPASMDQCTWIDVTDVPLGEYLLRIDVNPTQSIIEQSYANNVVDVLLECDQDCGAHGTCNFGMGCVCDAGWGGAACTIDTSTTYVCVPNCAGKACGNDGCGGICGKCSHGFTCEPTSGVCSCTPNCVGRLCGTDGCGGACGICRKTNTVCTNCEDSGVDCSTTIYSCALI